MTAVFTEIPGYTAGTWTIDQSHSRSPSRSATSW